MPFVLKHLDYILIADNSVAYIFYEDCVKLLDNLEEKQLLTLSKMMEPHLAQFLMRTFLPSLLRHLVLFRASLIDPWKFCSGTTSLSSSHIDFLRPPRSLSSSRFGVDLGELGSFWSICERWSSVRVPSEDRISVPRVFLEDELADFLSDFEFPF